MTRKKAEQLINWTQAKTALIRVAALPTGCLYGKKMPKDQVLKVRVIKTAVPNKHGVCVNAIIKLPNKEQIEINTVDTRNVALLVPSKLTPSPWKNILRRKGKDIAVAFATTCSPAATTLVNRHNLGRLRSEVSSAEISEITLWAGSKTPSEGKPELTECGTIHTVGGLILDFDFEIDHYC